MTMDLNIQRGRETSSQVVKSPTMAGTKRSFDVAFLMSPDVHRKSHAINISPAERRLPRVNNNNNKSEYERNALSLTSTTAVITSHFSSFTDSPVVRSPPYIHLPMDLGDRSQCLDSSCSSTSSGSSTLSLSPEHHLIKTQPDPVRSAFTKVTKADLSPTSTSISSSTKPVLTPEPPVYSTSLSPTHCSSTTSSPLPVQFLQPSTTVRTFPMPLLTHAGHNLLTSSKPYPGFLLSNIEKEKLNTNFMEGLLKSTTTHMYSEKDPTSTNVGFASLATPPTLSKLRPMLYPNTSDPYAIGAYPYPPFGSPPELIARPPFLATAGPVSTLLPPSLTALTLPAQNVCAKCNISFRMTSDLVYHMRSHHKGESDTMRRRREEKLKCPVCSESFRERHHLTRHMTAHQDKDGDDEEVK